MKAICDESLRERRGKNSQKGRHRHFDWHFFVICYSYIQCLNFKQLNIVSALSLTTDFNNDLKLEKWSLHYFLPFPVLFHYKIIQDYFTHIKAILHFCTANISAKSILNYELSCICTKQCIRAINRYQRILFYIEWKVGKGSRNRWALLIVTVALKCLKLSFAE